MKREISEMETFLCVDNFPPSLNSAEKREILTYFGAKGIFLNNAYEKRSSVYVSFKSHENASLALKRIHQLEIMGHRLTAVYAKENEISKHAHVSDSFPEGELDVKTKGMTISTKAQDRWKEFQKSLIGLAPHLKIDFPLSPALKFSYPPPDKGILHQINRALVAVPKLYIQVLHLMNKMNLPCPLLGNPTENPDSTSVNDDISVENMDITSEESEIESDMETPGPLPTCIPIKKREKSRKKLKRLNVYKSAALSSNIKPMHITGVFDVDQDKPKCKKLNINVTTTSFCEASKDELELCSKDDCSEGFGRIEPINTTLELEEHLPKEDNNFISDRELKENVLPKSQWSIMPVFNNYKEGEPSNRLYVKNIAKHVTSEDLKRIYGKYVDWNSEQETLMFDIRLMTEGRMKGQAFISFPGIEAATQALQDTNSFMLKGKALVVQFARSARPK